MGSKDSWTVPTKSFLLCPYGTSYLMIENCEGQSNPGPAEAPRICLLGQMFGNVTFPFPGVADLMAICLIGHFFMQIWSLCVTVHLSLLGPRPGQQLMMMEDETWGRGVSQSWVIMWLLGAPGTEILTSLRHCLVNNATLRRAFS